MLGRICSAALILFVAACGKPVDASGKQDGSFTKAGMELPTMPLDDPNRPLAADLAVLPVSMLVTYNRLHTGDKIGEFINKEPGKFSKVDIDKDKVPDPLSAAMKDIPEGHALEIHARPAAGDYIVATMLFDADWEFLGHYNGLKGGGASTVGVPLLTTGVPGPLPTINAAPAPAPTPVATTPVATTPVASPVASTPAAGTVTAVPAGSDQTAGVKTTP
jgi:hypothetical protein